MLRIALCLPQGIDKKETIVWPCIVNLYRFIEDDCQIREEKGPYVDSNRNRCVSERFFFNDWKEDANFDHILFVDDDIEFQPSHFLKLLSHNLPLVSGFYQWRNHTDHGVAGGGEFKDSWSWETTGLHEADFCGGGFLLVKREVFDIIRRPWFDHKYLEENGVLSLSGDDVTFCQNARDVGFSIWVDCDCKVDHVLSKKQKSKLPTRADTEKLMEGASLTVHDIIKKTHELQKSIYFLETALKETIKRSGG